MVVAGHPYKHDDFESYKYSCHARNAIENGFDLIIVADVTASAGEEALKGRSHQL